MIKMKNLDHSCLCKIIYCSTHNYKKKKKRDLAEMDPRKKPSFFYNRLPSHSVVVFNALKATPTHPAVEQVIFQYSCSVDFTRSLRIIARWLPQCGHPCRCQLSKSLRHCSECRCSIIWYLLMSWYQYFVLSTRLLLLGDQHQQLNKYCQHHGTKESFYQLHIWL